MTPEKLLEIFGPAFLSAVAAWGAIKVELRWLHQRIRALEKHQQLQSQRMWSIAKGSDDAS
jgi:hypothetical protein